MNTRQSAALLPDTVFINAINFKFDSYHLTDPDLFEKYRPLLGHADIKKVKVVGYTDEKGGQSYNQELSERRAAEVARLLTTRFGIPASVIQAAGMGISKDFRDDQRNRRVEIIIYR